MTDFEFPTVTRIPPITGRADYLFTVSGAGCLRRITAPEVARPPSLYTFRATVRGSARDCPRATGAIGFPRILPVHLVGINK